MKRIAILGGTGMAGNVAVNYMNEQGYDVYYTSLNAPSTSKSKALDAMDIASLFTWLDSVEPDVVFNCLGVLPKQCDERPDIAIFLNSYMPYALEHKYANESVKIIHLSTDCVFSGSRGGYTENDFPDGETIYDRSKALGEIVNDKDLTFRMSILGPDQNVNGVGLFNWFMSQTGVVRGFTKAIWTGVTTIELARAVDSAIKQDLTGLYHLVPAKSIDKYSLLCLFRDAFGRSDIEIKPDDGFVVDKSLINTRSDFDFSVRDYAKQVSDMREWVERHKSLYEHYF